MASAMDPHHPKAIAKALFPKKGACGEARIIELRGAWLGHDRWKGATISVPTSGWDGSAIIIVEVTPKGTQESIRVFVHVLWGEGNVLEGTHKEYSGNASADGRGTIPLYRARDLETFVRNAKSALESWLCPRSYNTGGKRRHGKEPAWYELQGRWVLELGKKGFAHVTPNEKIGGWRVRTYDAEGNLIHEGGIRELKHAKEWARMFMDVPAGKSLTVAIHNRHEKRWAGGKKRHGIGQQVRELRGLLQGGR